MGTSSFELLRSLLKRSLHCRMCRRIGAYVVLSILAIEGAILIPSYWNYERDLLVRLESTGRAEILATYRNAGLARERDLLIFGRLLSGSRGASLIGAVLYRIDGTRIGTIGTPPDLTLERARTENLWKERSADGLGYDIVWEAAENGLPVTVAARLDAGWIGAELTAFVWRITGLVLLISGFVTAVTMAILGRSVLLPLLRLRNSLTAARDDPAHADAHLLDRLPNDELGEAMDAVNRLLERVARTYREELATMNAMASQASDAILAYDGAGRILYANPACLLLCGFADAAEMEAADLPRFVFEGETREVTLPKSLAPGAYSRQAHLITRDERQIPTFVNATRPPSDADAPVQFYASITDISELHAAKDRLRQQNLALKAADRAKSEFLANMSHELRTPLNAIIGFSDVIKDERLGPVGSIKYREYAKDINESGQHLLALINDILDLSKIESGTDELHEENIDIPETVCSIMRLLTGAAQTSNVDLASEVPDGIPALRADARKLKQILVNLLSNAIKFTPDGGKVTLKIWASAESGYVFQVTDTGIGIAFEDIPKALASFQQIDSGLNRKHEGTGLGLPLTKSLIELHGGYLDLQSEAGVGTTVTVRFPSERVVHSPHDIEAVSAGDRAVSAGDRKAG